MPLISYRDAARRLGLTDRAFFRELLFGALAGVRRPSGLYVNLDEFRAFITPGGRV